MDMTMSQIGTCTAAGECFSTEFYVLGRRSQGETPGNGWQLAHGSRHCLKTSHGAQSWRCAG
jgi:hypothetical protein